MSLRERWPTGARSFSSCPDARCDWMMLEVNDSGEMLIPAELPVIESRLVNPDFTLRREDLYDSEPK